MVALHLQLNRVDISHAFLFSMGLPKLDFRYAIVHRFGEGKIFIVLIIVVFSFFVFFGIAIEVNIVVDEIP